MTYAQIFDDGDYNILFKKESYIINNHRQGGQSSQRFERIRGEQIKHWFKTCNEILNSIPGPIVLGTHEFYKNNLFKQFSSLNSSKILGVFQTEYADESGVYQYINKQKIQPKDL
jgi:peptide subunit release factor 1 (eRF1)